MQNSDLKLFKLILGFVLPLFLLAAGCARPEPPAKPEEEPRVKGTSQVEAVSQGDGQGYARVALTLENGTITAAQIKEFDGVGREKIYEDYHARWPYLEDAHNKLVRSIVENNTWDVDSVSGATETSKKVREGARFALVKARKEAETEHFDGTFMGVSDATEKGWGIAWVTLKEDEIIAVRLEGTTPAQENGKNVVDGAGRQVFVLKDEDYPWEPYHEAKKAVAEKIVSSQSTEVDTYTGATGSSRQWMEAAKRALASASTN